MKKELSQAEIERRFAEIDALGIEEASPEDIAAFEAAAAEDPDDALTLDEFRALEDYSGNVTLRIPKELHRELMVGARRNGVSMNQYAIYRLARG